MNSGFQHGRWGGIGFGVFTAGNIVSSTMLIWLAANGASVSAVLPFCLVTWSCYLGAHYLVDGEIVDRSVSDSSMTLPTSRKLQLLAITGIASMFMAFPAGIIAVSQQSLPLLLVAMILFVGGYNVGHYGITEKPL